MIPGLGICPGEGNGNPLQYSCLENPTDRGAWWVMVHDVGIESDTTERLNNNKGQNIFKVLTPTIARTLLGN